ncbi:hypothetical protein B0J13DRAFT_51061 [Dactylonectria estremocensis]|uniref:Uncharacterized protein n=1 Tax=Dactylonectria estremocensis TaxID=1079267 RepID=A0A9P9ERK0_9HYPO|nr:hypothetical protein B0J13DRAFT_51061 [Dactylonectria estremocensis]
MKRKFHDNQHANASTASKRQRPRALQTQPRELQDGIASRQQAERYRLVTAKIPLDALTCSWAKGTNRHVNRQHVSKLGRIFKQGSLERQAEENYLLVQCSAKAVARMISHLEAQGHDSQSDQVLSFHAWLSVNCDEKIEVMAGQHRIEALREYVNQIGADAKELWWTCNFYDREKLPLDLDIKLRVNRPDPSLPDSHGQIWMQLVSTASQNDALFQGKKSIVEGQMIDILRLDRVDRFPLSRLVTLWKNNRWRCMITWWCETEVGRAMFNISTWDWMASHRIDTYWFSTFEQVLNTLNDLPGNSADNVYTTDWAKIVATFPVGYSAREVKRLFYPRQLEESDSLVQDMHGHGLRRRSGFLEEMSDDAYHSVCHHICGHREMLFPDVQKLLRTTKEEGRTMMQVMTHVIAWLNPKPARVMDRRENNKPLLREDFKPALQAMANKRVNAVWATKVEESSIDLERRILDAVLDEMTSFKTAAIKATLGVLPADDRNGYGQRFMKRPWMTVLEKVEHAFGPEFGPSLTFALPTRKSDQVLYCQPTSSITRAICELVPQIQEVMEIPELNGQEAYEELVASIDKAVVQWVLQRCNRELANCKSNTESIRSNQLLQTIEVFKTRSELRAEATKAPWNASPDKGGKSTTYSALPIARDTLEQSGIEMSVLRPIASLPDTGPTTTPTSGQLRISSSSKSSQPQVSWAPFQALFLLKGLGRVGIIDITFLLI